VNSVLTGLEAHFRADSPVMCNYNYSLQPCTAILVFCVVAVV
jgi:hypothetical protein